MKNISELLSIENLRTPYDYFKFIVFIERLIVSLQAGDHELSDADKNSILILEETRAELTTVACHNYGILHPKDYSIEDPIPLPYGKTTYWHDWYNAQLKILNKFEQELEILRNAAEKGTLITTRFTRGCGEEIPKEALDSIEALRARALLVGYEIGEFTFTENIAYANVSVLKTAETSSCEADA